MSKQLPVKFKVAWSSAFTSVFKREIVAWLNQNGKFTKSIFQHDFQIDTYEYPWIYVCDDVAVRPTSVAEYEQHDYAIVDLNMGIVDWEFHRETVIYDDKYYFKDDFDNAIKSLTPAPKASKTYS